MSTIFSKHKKVQKPQAGAGNARTTLDNHTFSSFCSSQLLEKLKICQVFHGFIKYTT